MSEKNLNDDVTIAHLEDGEPLVSPEKLEEYKEVIAEIVEQAQETAVISEVEETAAESVISSSVVEEAVVESVPALAPVADGVIGSSSANRKPAAPKNPKISPKPEEEKVALFSTRNVTWSEVGKVYRGYNIVSKQAADKWLTRDHVRLATPEEVAREFGK